MSQMALLYSFIVTICILIFSLFERLYLLLFPKKMKSLAGKLVLITGGGGGLGKELAMEFSKQGARLVLMDIDEDANKRTAALASRPGMEVVAYTCDCTDETQVKKSIDEIENGVGPIDILINNAGILHGKSLDMLSCQQIRSTMNTNVLSVFWMTKACLQSMKTRRSGHIVNIASAAGLSGTAYLCDYSASKWALVGFNEALGQELRQENYPDIKLTCICPSFINTGMSWFPKTNVPWLLPVLNVSEAALDIVKGIQLEEKLVVLPRVLYFIIAAKWFMPQRAVIAVHDFLGLGIEPHVTSKSRRRFTSNAK